MKKIMLYKVDDVYDDFHRCREWDNRFYLDAQKLKNDMISHLIKYPSWISHPDFDRKESNIVGDGIAEFRPVLETLSEIKLKNPNPFTFALGCEMEYRTVKREKVERKVVVDGQEYTRTDMVETVQQDWTRLIVKERDHYYSIQQKKPYVFKKNFHIAEEELNVWDLVDKNLNEWV